jgi:prephenate dehydrogenase
LTKTIAMIGLNQVGASIGLALAPHSKEYQRIGYDRDVNAGPQAIRDGIIDKSTFNLPSAVEKADYVVFSVSPFELKIALDVVGPVLKEGAIVLDTSPLKVAPQAWAAQAIPAGRWYVSISPTLNPAFFSNPKPAADLFQNSLLVITAGKGTPEGVINEVIALAGLLGGQTQFSDQQEFDGQMAAVRQLPEMAAAALLHAVAEQPGWQESRKLTGPAFANASAPVQSFTGQEGPAEGLFENRDNTLRVLDTFMASLSDLRDLVAEGRREEANEFLVKAAAARQTWQEQRLKAEWEVTGKPTPPPDLITRLLGSRGRPIKK